MNRGFQSPTWMTFRQALVLGANVRRGETGATVVYAGALAHEMTHWTRHSRRLDRDFGRRRHGDAGYAREELVAELGAAFLCADLGLALEPREDHAAYLASWLKVLQDDRRFIVSAASLAQKAVDFLKTFQP